MIFLIAEIGLTIGAWTRGWKAWALLPLGIGFGSAFLLGLILGAMGLSEDSALMVSLIIDILVICVLIFMVAKGRKKEESIVYIAPAASPVAPPAYPPATPAVQLYKQQVMVQPAAAAEPATVVAPSTKARLVLPDNSEFVINVSSKTIGRNDFEKIVPPENLQYISRRQCTIKSEGSRFYIEDQNSSNSTKVNGVNIKGMGKQELKVGDKIDLADVLVLTFKVSSAV